MEWGFYMCLWAAGPDCTDQGGNCCTVQTQNTASLSPFIVCFMICYWETSPELGNIFMSSRIYYWYVWRGDSSHHRQMYTEEERGGRKCNGRELKLMMSHYWQAGRTGHQMHRGSSEAGEVGEDKEERGRQVKKRKCVREHCWPLTVKVSGCLFSAPVGAGSTRALISH